MSDDDQIYGIAPKIGITEDQPSLSDFGASKSVMPRSVLGTDIAPGQQISDKQMPKAEKLAADPKAEAKFSAGQNYHNQLNDFGDQKAALQRSFADQHAVLDHLMPTNIKDPNYMRDLASYSAEKNRIKQNEAEFKEANPWGSAGNHPGFFGKLGHVLGTIGNVAGEALAPGVTAAIPGSKLNMEEEAARAQGGIDKAEGQYANLQKAEAAVDTGHSHLKESDTHAITEPIKANAAASTADSKDRETTVAENKPINQAGADLAAGGDVNDPTMQRIIPVNTAMQKPGAEKTPPHITTQQKDGKPHIMERDPATGDYSIDRGVAPPNYGQSVLPTKTENLLGPDNIQHRYSWNPKTQRYDIDQGADPTGQAAHQIFQSAAIEQLVPQVVNDIQNHRDILGNLGSYYKQWTSGSPVADPDASRIMGELMSLAATQPALHAFRSTNALQAFEGIMGGLSKNPDATISTINGLMLLPQTFTGMIHHPGDTNKPNTPPASGSQLGSDEDFLNFQKSKKVK